jgi:hypothetical protein
MKTALRINTDFTTEVLDLSSNEYNQLRDAVGGLIQPVDLNSDFTLWCNEEGKLINGMEVNVIGTHLWEQFFGMTDVIMGNIVLTGSTDEEGETRALPYNWLAYTEEIAERLRSARAGESTVYVVD